MFAVRMVRIIQKYCENRDPSLNPSAAAQVEFLGVFIKLIAKHVGLSLYMRSCAELWVFIQQAKVLNGAQPNSWDDLPDISESEMDPNPRCRYLGILKDCDDAREIQSSVGKVLSTVDMLIFCDLSCFENSFDEPYPSSSRFLQDVRLIFHTIHDLTCVPNGTSAGPTEGILAVRTVASESSETDDSAVISCDWESDCAHDAECWGAVSWVVGFRTNSLGEKKRRSVWGGVLRPCDSMFAALQFAICRFYLSCASLFFASLAACKCCASCYVVWCSVLWCCAVCKRERYLLPLLRVNDALPRVCFVLVLHMVGCCVLCCDSAALTWACVMGCVACCAFFACNDVGLCGVLSCLRRTLFHRMESVVRTEQDGRQQTDSKFLVLVVSTLRPLICKLFSTATIIFSTEQLHVLPRRIHRINIIIAITITTTTIIIIIVIVTWLLCHFQCVSCHVTPRFDKTLELHPAY